MLLFAEVYHCVYVLGGNVLKSGFANWSLQVVEKNIIQIYYSTDAYWSEFLDFNVRNF